MSTNESASVDESEIIYIFLVMLKIDTKLDPRCIVPPEWDLESRYTSKAVSAVASRCMSPL